MGMDSGVALSKSTTWVTLEAMVRDAVQTLLQRALEAELTEHLGRAWYERRAVVDAPVGYRNGHGKPRRLTLSCGTVTLRRPRMRNLEQRFVSRLLPLFVRRTTEVGALLPALYLHGLALGDFELALRGLLGDGAPLSPKSIERLKSGWEAEYRAWAHRDLRPLEIQYLWADGIYVKAGLGQEKAALLVVIGVSRGGRKHVLAVLPGYRESTESWATVLRDLKARGVSVPKVLVGDGALGLWAAVRSVWPALAEQRCWNHKLCNVLDALPRSVQSAVRVELTAIPYAPTRREAEERRDAFVRAHQDRHPQAVARLIKDWGELMTFYRFPQPHWKSLRTSNVVESPFAAVRLRTAAGKRFKKVTNATPLIWKVLMVAERTFRRIDGHEWMAKVADGRRFVDGHEVSRPRATKRAA